MKSEYISSERVIYKEIDGWKLPMDIYYPKGYDPQKQYPAVVCIHGGAWKALVNKASWTGNFMNKHAMFIAQNGAIGIAISYRSLGQEGKPELSDLIRDCRSAIRYLRIHSREYGINVDKIAAWGDSAGGHLAACLGTIDEYNHSEEDNNVNASVNLVIACNPILYLTDSRWISYCNVNGDVSDKERTAKAKSVSPYYHIDSTTPPFLLMHGEMDTIVNPWHSKEFCSRMQEYNRPCELTILPKARHAFILWDYTTESDVVDIYVEMVRKYLIRKEYLPC